MEAQGHCLTIRSDTQDGDCYLVNVSKWAWTCEQNWIFWNILLTHGTKYCMMWRNMLPCVQGWKIKIDEKKRWKIHVHRQKLCVNPNTTSSQLKGIYQLKHHMFISNGYVPIRNWDIMRLHILYTISTYFLFEFSLSNHLCLTTFLLLEGQNGWKIKRWTKRMNKTYSQPKVMCQSKLYLFTTKRYVSIETPLVHLQEVCSHKELK